MDLLCDTKGKIVNSKKFKEAKQGYALSVDPFNVYTRIILGNMEHLEVLTVEDNINISRYACHRVLSALSANHSEKEVDESEKNGLSPLSLSPLFVLLSLSRVRSLCLSLSLTLPVSLYKQRHT